MKVVHPTDPWRNKNIPDEMAEKFLAGGWTVSESKPKAPARRAPKK